MRKHLLTSTAILVLFCLVILALPTFASGQVYLIQLPRKYFSNCMWSSEHAKMGDTEVDSYIYGLGTEADATIMYDLDGKYDMFESLVGFSNSTPEGRSCTFELWADGALVNKVGPLTSGGQPDVLRANIRGAKKINLRMVPGHYNGTAGAVWGNPRLYYDLGKDETPGTIVVNSSLGTYQAMPNKIGEQRFINVPIPVNPGVNEYRLTTKFDETTGKMQILTVDASGQDVNREVIKIKENQGKNKSKSRRR